MTIDEVQKLIQGIFDNIFNSVTKAEPGGKPLLGAATTMLSLMKPGLAINANDFRNPWTPGNPNGDKDAAVNLAALVDVAPAMSGIYTDTGNRITQIYQQILDGVSIPAQPTNAALDKQLADADAVLWRTVDVVDQDTGVAEPRRMQTTMYRDYEDLYTAYFTQRSAYTTAYMAAQETTIGKQTWPLLGPSLSIPVKQAYDKWRASGADKVEQALAIVNTSTQNALQKAFNNAKKSFQGYGASLDVGSGTEELIYRSSLLPSNWYSSSNNSGWTTYDSNASTSTSVATSDYKSYGGSAGFSLGIFSIGGSAGHTSTSQHASAETTGMRISFRYTLVTIRRPWMTYNLLGTKTWNLSNLYAKGKVSNGGKTGQDAAAMPLYPTSFVVVKDVVISANWSKADHDLITSKINGGGGFSIGPFSIGGTYASSKSKETYSSAFAGGKITVPGVQIIGVISQVVPYCPPA